MPFIFDLYDNKFINTKKGKVIVSKQDLLHTLVSSYYKETKEILSLITDNKDIDLLSTFSLYSEVIQINNVNDGTVGYNGTYKGQEGIESSNSIGNGDGVLLRMVGEDANHYMQKKEM